MASLATVEKAPSGKPLKVSSPHDPAEREAERIADLLTASEEPPLPLCAACAVGGSPCGACGGGGGGGEGSGLLLRQTLGGGGDVSFGGGEMVAATSVHRKIGRAHV